MKVRILVIVLLASAFLTLNLVVGEASIMAYPHFSGAAAPTPVTTANVPVFREYKGVALGTSAADARAKLGKAKETSDLQDFYTFGKGETLQIVYDNDKTVKAISCTFLGDEAKGPTPIQVFGVEVAAQADGSINKMAKYPKLGFWISYIKTGGDDPMIMVTLHKLQAGEQ